MARNNNIHPGIAGLKPYQPGKPVDELTRELGITDIVKLASNENPRGPGPAVRRAIQAQFEDMSRYPDGSGYNLRRALVDKLGIEADQITLGNGSNDVLDLIARVTVQPGDEAIVSQHSFVVYRIAVACAGGTLVTVPARDHGADLIAMQGAITERTSTIFLANPNNPTGTWVNKDALLSFLRAVPKHVWVVLDEAYFEYSEHPDYPNGLELLNDFPNLVVTRTFSKAYGLAASRVGYSVSQADFADLLNRARQPFNVNSLGLAAATAALSDDQYLAESREINAAGLARLSEGLGAMGFDYIPSLGNFISFDCGEDGAKVYQKLLQEGVIVRPIAEYELPTFLRVSVGLDYENERFLNALKKVCDR